MQKGGFFFLMMLGQLVIDGGNQILASDSKQKQIPGGLMAQEIEN